MKALILVGGYGTRLRPLTLSQPKPLVEFCNKAMVMHQIEALVAVGVTEVVLAVNYQPLIMKQFLQSQQKKLGVKITTSHEIEPLGTAGPIKLAQKHLDDGDPFFVLNSDVSCNYPFQKMIDFHKKSNAKGTLLVTKVEEPSKFGVVIYDQDDGCIERFVEKPQRFVGNRINSGIYLLEPDVFDIIEMRPTSIEKEVFPKMAEKGELYCMELEGFWADVGQPKDFLKGTRMYLNHLRQNINSGNGKDGDSVELASGPEFIGNVLVDPSAKIGNNCKIGPDVVIGPGCEIHDGVRLINTTLLPGAIVRSHSWISTSIIGWASNVGEWVRIENNSVLGEDVTIKAELYINASVILPHKSVKNDLATPQIVM